MVDCWIQNWMLILLVCDITKATLQQLTAVELKNF